jgi:hypothetical protein
MRERGDLDVLHEPFMYDYYLNQSAGLFPDFEPETDHPRTFADIRDMILKRAQAQQVFFKDMAYYVLSPLPANVGFLRQMTHCFLVRDPAESILSYQRKDPNLSLTEVGIEAQFWLYQVLRAAGITPHVILADDLRQDPRRTMAAYWDYAGLPHVADAFAWDSRVPPGWESVKGWHQAVLESGAIQKPTVSKDCHLELAKLDPKYASFEAHHRPFFDALADIARQQILDENAHQK